MDYSIKQQQKRKIAGFHLVGPWEQTVKQGFEQLVMWVDGRHIEPLEWVAVYYDNPDEVPAEKLRCDTAVTVPDDFVIPENSEGVMMTEIAGGLCRGDGACGKLRLCHAVVSVLQFPAAGQ
jgi:DNA gyrase inhibitor